MAWDARRFRQQPGGGFSRWNYSVASASINDPQLAFARHQGFDACLWRAASPLVFFFFIHIFFLALPKIPGQWNERAPVLFSVPEGAGAGIIPFIIRVLERFWHVWRPVEITGKREALLGANQEDLEGGEVLWVAVVSQPQVAGTLR
jgi:hypothetical protein